MKHEPFLSPEENNENRSFVHYLIGIEMAFSIFIYEYYATYSVNSRIGHKRVLHRHRAIILSILDRLAECVYDDSFSEVSLGALADGNSMVESFKSTKGRGDNIELLCNVNMAILQCLEKQSNEDIDAGVKALFVEIINEHQRIALDLLALKRLDDLR